MMQFPFFAHQEGGNAMNGNVLDMSLETEEFITAEEYMKRRKAGAIDPARVRYAVNPPNGQIGGFYVKLERPRYRVAIPSVKRRIKNAR